jgi:hypothetical protein
MKKLMTVMLGLSLIVGTTSLFGQEKDTSKKSEKKKKGKKKSTDSGNKG